jgi:hypothetical protein
MAKYLTSIRTEKSGIGTDVTIAGRCDADLMLFDNPLALNRPLGFWTPSLSF